MGGEVFHRRVVTAAFPSPTCLVSGQEEAGTWAHPGPARVSSVQEGSPATRASRRVCAHHCSLRSVLPHDSQNHPVKLPLGITVPMSIESHSLGIKSRLFQNSEDDPLVPGSTELGFP